jgi:transcriptional regulator with PAS, ATPase and Fis domain
MSTETIDDQSSVAAVAQAVPAIVMVATSHRPASLVLAPPATLGRRCAADERMSKEHATVAWERGAWRITDLDSRNGTFVDGERIAGNVRRTGDVVLRLGRTVFLLLADGRGQPYEPGDPVIGPELARVYDQIRAHARGDNLLVHGESGSGKELAARLYHEAGPRRRGPFVAINCATIPEGVAERLLFGSRKGAFSGATDASGHFLSANGGTLFLDEIADLDPVVQAKVLRVLETREVIPVGATHGSLLDVGIVAASHRELHDAVAARQFRDDLYYRIARATVRLPPLRQRKVDIVRLVERSLRAIDPALAAHAKLVEACCIRAWPGNVRELTSAIEAAAIAARTAERELVRIEDLPPDAGLAIAASPGAVPRPSAPAEIPREAVVAALADANGVVSVAARALGLHRTQLYRLLDKYEIARGEDS